ncbi:uncharacterized protein LOC143461274 [Clavelina lepadiformis]|uniref:uncharacterized protein LOC143461274 n=1 Tax=Clavelina lepadiformis TaxID=159417 RepID=UPI00404176FA
MNIFIHSILNLAICCFTLLGAVNGGLISQNIYSCNGGCMHVLRGKQQNTSQANITPKTCNVENLEHTPFPQDDESTAPPPNWMNASWYVYQRPDNESSIALNLTWNQTGSGFQSYVKGYFLIVKSTTSDAKTQFFRKFSFNGQLNATKVIFNYQCFGTGKEEIKPERNYILLLMAFPLHHKNSEVQDVPTFISIPSCSDRRISMTYHCVYEYDDDDFLTDYDYDYSHEENHAEDEHRFSDVEKSDSSDDKPSYQMNVTIIVVVFVVCAMIGIFAIFCYYKHVKVRTEYKNKSVLMLIFQSEGDQMQFDLSSRIATLMKNHGCIDVSFNLWDKYTMSDTIDWFDKRKHCDHIVLICTTSGKKSWDLSPHSAEIDPFILGLREFKKDMERTFLWQRHKCRFSCLYFDQDADVLPNVIKQHKSSIQCYSCIQDFDKLFHKLTGKYASLIPSDQLHYLQVALNHSENENVLAETTSLCPGDNSVDGRVVVGNGHVHFALPSSNSNILSVVNSSQCETCVTTTTPLSNVPDSDCGL